MNREIWHTKELGEVMTTGFEQLDLTTTWVGIASLVIFVIGYYFIAAEDKYNINKVAPNNNQ